MIQTLVGTLLWLSQWLELAILLKVTVVFVLGLVAARVASRARASVRHLFLAATFGAAIAVPLVVATAPEFTIWIPPVGSPIESRLEVVSSGGTATMSRDVPRTYIAALPYEPNRWEAIGRWTWFGGGAAVCASLLLALWRVRQIRRHALPRYDLEALLQPLAGEAGIRRRIEVLEHEHLIAPLTCGVRRPAILVPVTARDWDATDIRRALIHELEHVRRGDWAMQLAARAVCAYYWFHPLAWVALRQLCLDAERACDDAVVRTAERTDYADQLVLLARKLSAAHAPGVLGMANRSDLAARVAALLDDGRRRGRAGLLTAGCAAIAAMLIVAAIAPARALVRNDAEPAVQAEQTPRAGRPRGIDRALYEAAEQGDLADINQLIGAGANVNAAIDGDGSPLIGAVRSGRLQVVRLLLDRGADVNMAVPGDGSPLIVAASEGSASIVALLLDRGADVDQLVPDDESALIQASGGGHLDVVKLLVARGANVNLGVWVERNDPPSQREWRSPLSVARREGHASVVAFLTASGAHQ